MGDWGSRGELMGNLADVQTFKTFLHCLTQLLFVQHPALPKIGAVGGSNLPSQSVFLGAVTLSTPRGAAWVRDHLCFIFEHHHPVLPSDLCCLLRVLVPGRALRLCDNFDLPPQNDLPHKFQVPL